MNRILMAILFCFCLLAMAKSQTPLTTNKEDIIGRWVESRRIDGDSTIFIDEYADTYIFKENGVFHKGEAAEGVIVFNITGRYTVEGNTITILYRDYTRRGATKQPAKKLSLKVVSHIGDEIIVSVKDYDFEYEMILKRQQ